MGFFTGGAFLLIFLVPLLVVLVMIGYIVRKPGAGSGEATGEATRTYLICPYPQRSVFKGGVANAAGLAVNDARNWSCKG